MYLSRLVILVVVYSLPCDVSLAPSTDTPVDGVSCKSQADCPLNQCCVHNPLNKPDSRKRFLFDHYNEHDHGFCRSARNLNENCWPIGEYTYESGAGWGHLASNNPKSRDPANGELYEFFCPCTSGLECRGLIVHESAHQIVHERPMCQSPESSLIDSATYSGQVCSADGDCPGGMCCVFHPDNRRQQSTGYCRNFKQLNDTCTIVGK
ncbi:hypothetical protein MAR_004516 [Mya arenaria]|uniref:Uncharacterized protein n=1 Tax=Mya arenaria TaxID=6604 RepID=A0ABY7F517_MYAAR|nr:hypothetical protein MAR_004516 [Mya arenaria]